MASLDRTDTLRLWLGCVSTTQIRALGLLSARSLNTCKIRWRTWSLPAKVHDGHGVIRVRQRRPAARLEATLVA